MHWAHWYCKNKKMSLVTNEAFRLQYSILLMCLCACVIVVLSRC